MVAGFVTVDLSVPDCPEAVFPLSPPPFGMTVTRLAVEVVLSDAGVEFRPGETVVLRVAAVV